MKKKTHSFVKHYQEGGNLLIELKPIKKNNFDRDFQKFSRNYDDHSSSYDFTDGMVFLKNF